MFKRLGNRTGAYAERRRLAAAWSVIAAVLMLAVTPLWHTHEARGEEKPRVTRCCSHSESPERGTPAKKAPEHDSCAVCLAASMPTGTGLGAPALLIVEKAAGEPRIERESRAPMVRFAPKPPARGPPI